jgi:hypothetical protein
LTISSTSSKAISTPAAIAGVLRVDSALAQPYDRKSRDAEKAVKIRRGRATVSGASAFGEDAREPDLPFQDKHEQGTRDPKELLK